MTSLLHPFLFSLDIILVVTTAWGLVRIFSAELPSRLEQFLGWGLGLLLVVAGSGVLLGITGGLGQPGFLAIHSLAFGALLVGRKSRWREDAAALGSLFAWRERDEPFTRAEAILLVVLLAASTLLLALAFFTEPVVFDALTYRLSRVGHWLQEGRIGLIGGDDARLNYMPVAPDLMMAWMLTGSASDYGAVAVTQALGGLLALGATVGLARLLGVGRAPALAAACVVLGLPNVAPQFTAAYTDLFTTGVLAAGFYLWLAALFRGSGSVAGGAAAGLALGAKGTVFYFAPGLLLAAGWLAWRHRVGRAAWTRTLLSAVLMTVVFALPTMRRNLAAYGAVFGPEEFVVLHHGKNPGWEGSMEKLRLNLQSALVQLLEPNSQLGGWQGLTRAAGESIMTGLPEQDAYAFQGLNRRAELQKIYALAAPDADVTSTGILLPLLAVAAVVTAWFRRKSAAGELALVWSVAVAGFILFLHWRVQWHPYLFRFIGLAAPWLAALAVWWIQTLAGGTRAVAWVVTGVVTTSGFWGALSNTYQSGWPAIARPVQSTGFYVYENWRTWSAALDRPDEPLRPALSVNSPLAAFYRQDTSRLVIPESLSALPVKTAAEATQPGTGWMIVPVAQFLGREGRVLARSWLYDGDEHHPYSVVAFRALLDGERPAPVIYRNKLVAQAGGMQRQFLVRTWDATPQRLELSNPGGAPCRYEVFSPVGNTAGELAPGAKLLLEISLPPDRVSAFAVAYPTPTPATGWVHARLVP